MMKLLILLLLSNIAFASDYIKVPYLGSYDGDTFYTEFDLPEPLDKMSVRIYGIDTPEKGSRAKCDVERKLANAAHNYLDKLIGNQKYVYLSDVHWDKYGGRVLAKVYIKKDAFIEIAPLMIKNGYAIEYYGEKKEKDWCDEN